jgi:hypothetical protein
MIGKIAPFINVFCTGMAEEALREGFSGYTLLKSQTRRASWGRPIDPGESFFSWPAASCNGTLTTEGGWLGLV